MDNLIDEIALRCNDAQFEDFKKSTYKSILYRVLRELARKYQLLERKISLNNQNTNPSDWIQLKIPSFREESRINVNGVLFVKDIALNDNTYYLKYENNKSLFNYSPKAEKDVIEIYYLCDISKEDYDLEETTPIIPKMFEEEVIGECCKEIAKLGIPKFGKEVIKGQKYISILELYSKRENLNQNLVKNNSWVTIELWEPF